MVLYLIYTPTGSAAAAASVAGGAPGPGTGAVVVIPTAIAVAGVASTEEVGIPVAVNTPAVELPEANVPCVRVRLAARCSLMISKSESSLSSLTVSGVADWPKTWLDIKIVRHKEKVS